MKRKVKCVHSDDISKCPSCYEAFTGTTPTTQDAEELPTTEKEDELKELVYDLIEQAMGFGQADFSGHVRTAEERNRDYEEIVEAAERIEAYANQALQAFGEKVLKELPTKKEPSDPTHHNKPYKPVTVPHDCGDPECGHVSEPTPRSIVMVRNANDGFNDALDDVVSVITSLMGKET